MTEHKPGDVVGIFSHKVQLAVPIDRVPPLVHSYVDVEKSDEDVATVTLEAGKTFFELDGEIFLFDGVTQRPDKRESVAMIYPDGFFPDEGHMLNPTPQPLSVSDLANLIVTGELEPVQRPGEVTN